MIIDSESDAQVGVHFKCDAQSDVASQTDVFSITIISYNKNNPEEHISLHIKQDRVYIASITFKHLIIILYNLHTQSEGGDLTVGCDVTSEYGTSYYVPYNVLQINHCSSSSDLVFTATLQEGGPPLQRPNPVPVPAPLLDQGLPRVPLLPVLELLDHLFVTEVPLVRVGLLLVDDQGLGVSGNP